MIFLNSFRKIPFFIYTLEKKDAIPLWVIETKFIYAENDWV